MNKDLEIRGKGHGGQNVNKDLEIGRKGHGGQMIDITPKKLKGGICIDLSFATALLVLLFLDLVASAYIGFALDREWNRGAYGTFDLSRKDIILVMGIAPLFLGALSFFLRGPSARRWRWSLFFASTLVALVAIQNFFDPMLWDAFYYDMAGIRTLAIPPNYSSLVFYKGLYVLGLVISLFGDYHHWNVHFSFGGNE